MELGEGRHTRKLNRIPLTISGLVLAGAVLAWAVAAIAQAGSATPTPGDLVEGRAAGDGAGPARIPFELERDRTIVKVQVAGSRPQRLILDTGMPMDGVYLFHKEFETEVALEGAIEVRIPGAGSGEASTGIMAESVPLSAGDVVFGRQRVIVSHSDQTQGFPTDGIIGWSLFGHYAVELDYDEMLITLHPPATFAPDSSWQALPMTLKKNIPWITASVDVQGGGAVPIECYIDFASGDAVELLVRPNAKFPIPENLTQTYLGTGLSGDIHGGVGRVASLTIGSHTLHDVTATFPPAEVRSKQGSADAIIGNQSLRRFNLVFDYADSTLWIKPNGAFGEPF
jgi:hypothetical protein